MKLTGADLSDVNALGLPFEYSLLVSANLHGMSFRKQRLKQLNFSEADLAGCVFQGAVFEGGSISGASLRQTRFEKPTCARSTSAGCALASWGHSNTPLFHTTKRRVAEVAGAGDVLMSMTAEMPRSL